jgi:hypothetical protein
MSIWFGLKTRCDSEFLLLQLHGAMRHIVSRKMSLELIPHDGVNICMGVAICLPSVGCCSIELVRSKKDFLMIRALGDHEFFLNSLKLIFSFHWVPGLGECGRLSLQEFPKPGLRWWWCWLLLLLSLVVRLELV